MSRYIFDKIRYLPRDAAWEREIQLQLNVEAALAITVCRRDFDCWPNGFKAVSMPNYLVAGWTCCQSVIKKIKNKRSRGNGEIYSRHNQREDFLSDEPLLEAVPKDHLLVVAKQSNDRLPGLFGVATYLPEGSRVSFPIYTLLGLYEFLGDMTRDEALKHLAEHFDADDTTSWLNTKFSDCWKFASGFCGSSEVGKVIYEHCSKTSLRVRLCVEKDSKALVATTTVSPKAASGTTSKVENINIEAPVLPKSLPLLRPSLERLEYSLFKGENMPPVMLTDCVELAVQEEYMAALQKSIVYEFVSWWGGEESLDKTDFTPLENRTVLYVLASHSARTDAEVCQTARRVCQALPQSCKVSFQSRLGPVWELMGDEDFQRLAHWKIECGGGALEAKATASTLFHPLLRQRNVIVISGSRNPVTWFALSIAASLRGAQRAFAPSMVGWGPAPATGDVPVIYCKALRRGSVDITSILTRIHKGGNIHNDPNILFPQVSASHKLTATDADQLLVFLDNLAVKTLKRGPVNAHVGPILIVLDGVLSLAGAASGKSRDCFQQLMKAFAARNWATIICTSELRSSKNLARYLERTGIDCIVELEEAVHPTQPSLLVTADVLHSAASDQPNQSARLLFSRDDQCHMWSPCYIPAPIAERERRIRKLAAMGYGPKEIYGILTNGEDHVSYVNVRKILERLGLTKKRKAAVSDPWC